MNAITIKSEEIQRLYKRVKNVEGYAGKSGYAFFCRAIHDSILVLEFPWGIVRVTDFIKGQSVMIHGLFLNKGILKSMDEIKKNADYALGLFKINKIIVIVPAGSKGLARILDRSCFKKVLPLRDFVYNGIMYEDGDLYEYGGEG